MKLGDRMKGYENAYRYKLPERLPIILRIDGKAFHSYTRGLPAMDPTFTAAMEACALALTSQLMGAKIAYVQSDEISVLLYPWSSQNSTGYFDNNIIKLVSVSASIASATMTLESAKVFGKTKPAYFDSRAFIVPEDEVVNYFIWRQQDAVRNSINMLGQSFFSHKELHGVNTKDLRAKILEEKSIDWDKDLPTKVRRGACAVRVSRLKGTTMRRAWVIDEEIPDFIENREYIQSLISEEAEV